MKKKNLKTLQLKKLLMPFKINIIVIKNWILKYQEWRRNKKPKEQAYAIRVPWGAMGKMAVFAANLAFYSPPKATKQELGPMIGGGRVEYETFIKVEKL